jgi:hypothetical protein
MYLHLQGTFKALLQWLLFLKDSYESPAENLIIFVRISRMARSLELPQRAFPSFQHSN